MAHNYDQKKYQKLDESLLDRVAGGADNGGANLYNCIKCKDPVATCDTSSGKPVYTCPNCNISYYFERTGAIVYC